MVAIKKVDQLIKNLNMGAGYGGYNALFSSIDIPTEEWKQYITWKESRYTRNCISSCDDYELLLMCWGKEHCSPIHNFSLQEGWIKVIEGELTIHRYDMDRGKLCCHKIESIVLKAGESTYLNDSMGFHKVENTADDKTISLHLNIGKVSEWEVFRACRQKTILVTPIQDTNSEDCDEIESNLAFPSMGKRRLFKAEN